MAGLSLPGALVSDLSEDRTESPISVGREECNAWCREEGAGRREQGTGKRAWGGGCGDSDRKGSSLGRAG